MAQADGSDEYQRDARDLRRGVVVNLAGYVLKLVYAIGPWLIVPVYGAEALGILAAGQAALILIMRIGMLGLDKGLHWWVARQPPERERVATRPVAWVTLAVSGTLSVALVGFAAPWIGAWKSDPALGDSLRYIGLALVPMALTEIFIAACLGKRRMEAWVTVKDGIVPVVFVVAALGIGIVPAGRELGLPIAFMISHLCGLAGAIVMYRRIFADSPPVPVARTRFPREMVRYCVPMWGTEILNSMTQRVDVLILASMTDAATVGVYAVIVHVGNSMRAIRRAFDPIVLSIASRIGARKDFARLKAGVSYATSLVMLTQAPVYAFIIAFAPVILAWLGTDFDAAVLPIVILAAFWTINGVIGLQLIVVIGYGRSDLSMLNLVVALALQVGLLFVLIPSHGLEGAAWAVGIAALVQNLLALAQARLIVGGWAYDAKLWWLVAMIPGAGVAMGAAWWLGAPLPDLPRRIVTFVAFVLAQGGTMLLLHRTHQFVRPIARRDPGRAAVPVPVPEPDQPIE